MPEGIGFLEDNSIVIMALPSLTRTDNHCDVQWHVWACRFLLIFLNKIYDKSRKAIESERTNKGFSQFSITL